LRILSPGVKQPELADNPHLKLVPRSRMLELQAEENIRYVVGNILKRWKVLQI
jgi:hypothetical protein